MPLFLFIVKPKLKIKPPQSDVMPKVVKILSVLFRQLCQEIVERHLLGLCQTIPHEGQGREYFNSKKQTPITWNDQWVLDIKQTIDSCKIFVYYIVFNLADSGLGSVETSLSGAMRLDGVPNDLFNNFNPITIIVIIPILEYVIYPLFNRYGINFKPIYRICFGFVVCSFSQIAGYILQKQVYELSPCGYYASGCDEPAPLPPGKPPLFSSWPLPVNVGLTPLPTSWPTPDPHLQ